MYICLDMGWLMSSYKCVDKMLWLPCLCSSLVIVWGVHCNNIYLLVIMSLFLFSSLLKHGNTQIFFLYWYVLMCWINTFVNTFWAMLLMQNIWGTPLTFDIIIITLYWIHVLSVNKFFSECVNKGVKLQNLPTTGAQKLICMMLKFWKANLGKYSTSSG